ncbi:EAL domain-containing protein [Sulfurimonas sp. HSL3-2]|uniref:sensor domain-containing protein n=1 Tax=Hydrocurvibacter mobilis TaxID=3131936 RepID=UPI0031F84AD3
MYIKRLISETYESLRLSLIGIVANATALSIIFQDKVDNTLLVSWYITVVMISLMRFISLQLFQTRNHYFTSEKWSDIFTLGVILSALSWGVTPFVFFIPGDYLYQMVFIIILAGLSAGAITALAQFLFNVHIFLIALIVPLLLQLLLQHTTVHLYLALLVFLYLVLLLYVSKKFNKNYTDTARSYFLFEQKRDELLKSEQKYESIFKNVPIGIFFYDTKLIIQEVNQEFIHFLEAPREFLIGLDMNLIKDQRIVPTLKAPFDDIQGFYEGEYRTLYATKDIWISMTTSPIKNADNEVIGAIGIVSDITQRILIQQHVEHQANYDSLTDIPNRISLLKDINKEIIRFKRHGQLFGVIFLDLDRFKNINDSLGHGIGDKLLIETAKRLSNAIRKEDTVARIGGDEFVVLVPDLGTQERPAATKMEHIAHKIHETLNTVFEIDGYSLNISSSIGISLVNDDTEDADDLLKHADIAMYQSKKEGRNTTRFYQNEMDIWVKRRLDIENELRLAIQRDELEVHYQPIVEFSTSGVVGAEALLRWKNGKLGEVFPDEFIPIAEESGLILGIGEWVLSNAVEQFVAWQKQFPHITSFKKIAVNVSTYQFNNKTFLAQVENVIRQSGIKANNLELELTESIIVTDIESVRNKMLKLRELGVNLSIDDFGTGYSSLSYLKMLPFTTLKIDKSFTQDVQDNTDDRELISTIVTIAQNFNLEVVIEGVETYEQYIFTNEKKPQYMQGYYCSRPVSKEQFTVMLDSSNGVCDKLI